MLRSLTAAIVLFTTACAPGADGQAGDKARGMNPEQALQALDIFWISGQPEHSLRLAMELSSRVSAEEVVVGDLSNLTNAWDRLAPCTSSESSEETVEVSFGELGDCDLLGAPALGTVRYGLSAMDADVLADIELLPFGATGWSADGSMGFLWGADDVHELEASLDWSQDGSSKVSIDTSVVYRPAEPTEGLWGLVQVDGQRQVEDINGVWSIDLTEAMVQHPVPMPVSGRARIVSPDGAEMVATFTPIDEQFVRIDASTGARQISLEMARDGSSLTVMD